MDAEVTLIAERVKQAYAQSELKIINPGVLQTASIDPVDSHFLSTVGVPRIEQFEMDFNHVDTLPTLGFIAFSSDVLLPDELTEVRCLNERDGVVYAVQNNKGGRVVLLDLNCKPPNELFLNTKIRYMVGFLAECRLLWADIDQDRACKDLIFDGAMERMRRMDMDGSNSLWWREVFADIELYA